MISASSLQRIIGTLTKGQLKSKAGLDDEDVFKGSRNIERLAEIYSILAISLGHTKDKQDEMTKLIDWVLQYHRTGFISHLSRNAKRRCQCISCGLHCSDEPIQCPYRDAENHNGSCNDCEKSFQVFSDLLFYSKYAKNKSGLTVTEKQPFDELEAEIIVCCQNLKEWRSHIVRKVVESEFSRSQLRDLKKDEAIVVSDFKMKILPMYLKETKREFFR